MKKTLLCVALTLMASITSFSAANGGAKTLNGAEIKHLKENVILNAKIAFKEFKRGDLANQTVLNNSLENILKSCNKLKSYFPQINCNAEQRNAADTNWAAGTICSLADQGKAGIRQACTRAKQRAKAADTALTNCLKGLTKKMKGNKSTFGKILDLFKSIVKITIGFRINN